MDTGKELALVIMTHHHADHISGFAIGQADFKEFSVEQVWMPWFEDPTNKTATAFQANITAVATHLQLQFGAQRRNDQFSLMAENITGVMTAAGASNDVAIATLKGGFKDPKTPVAYFKAGDPAKLPPSLVSLGLTAKIVGPPGPDQLALVAQMDNNKYQYLGEDTNAGSPPARINDVFRATEREYPREAFALFSAKKIADQIEAAQPDVLAAQAQKADNTINNQSLVVYFEFGGKTMLFAGRRAMGQLGQLPVRRRERRRHDAADGCQQSDAGQPRLLQSRPPRKQKRDAQTRAVEHARRRRRHVLHPAGRLRIARPTKRKARTTPGSRSSRSSMRSTRRRNSTSRAATKSACRGRG